VERFVSPVVDPAFEAVGGYYADFTQVSDEDVAALLARSAGRGGVARAPGESPGGEH
jgi:predicted phosphoribosyltransferase